jgi:hypothetical protein
VDIETLNNLCKEYVCWDSDITDISINNLLQYFEFKCREKDFNDGTKYEIVYSFNDCYKLKLENDIDYDKEYKRYYTCYAIQDIKFEETEHRNVTFFKCILDAYPLSAEILCRNIEIKKVFLST